MLKRGWPIRGIMGGESWVGNHGWGIMGGESWVGNHGWGIMGGMARGVAFVPAVPGLAPGACMGWAILSRLGKRSRGRMPEGNIRREGTGNPDPLDMSQENP